MKFPSKALGVALLGLVAGPAAGADPAEVAASFSITNDRMQSRAVLALDPEAPVADVVLEAPGCHIDAMVEVEPGYWLGVSPTGRTNECVSATLTLHLEAAASSAGLPNGACPFIGFDKVKMSGSSHTDAYDSSEAAYAPEMAVAAGDVCSNGDIRLSGSATIHGDAIHGADGELGSSGNAGVTGAIQAAPEPYEAEPIDSQAVFVNDNQQLPRTQRGRDAVDEDGKLKLSGGDRLVLPPGTYFFSEVKLSGGSTLDIDGPVVIQTLRGFDASGGSVVNRTQVPADLEILVMDGGVKLSGGSDLHAIVQAPFGKIKYSSHSDFYGALVAEKLELSGSAGLHADLAGFRTGGDGSVVVLTWREPGEQRR